MTGVENVDTGHVPDLTGVDRDLTGLDFLDTGEEIFNTSRFFSHFAQLGIDKC